MQLRVNQLFASDEELTSSYLDAVIWAEAAGTLNQAALDADYQKLVKWQDHPEQFMNEVLNFFPWTCEDADDQLDIVYAIRDHSKVSVRSGNGIGKTAIAARIAIWFLTCFYKSIVITTAPTTRQVEKLLWGEIREAYKTSNIPLGGELLTTQIRKEDKWYALGFSTDEKEKFQGYHAPYILVIVDEASGMAEPIFEAIEGLLTTENAKVLLISNPTNPTSYFGRTHLHPRESKEWMKLHIDCYNSPNVRAGRQVIPELCSYKWPDRKRKSWGEYNPFFKVRVLGEFPETGEDCLIPYHMVHSALERTSHPAGSKVLAIDVARFGDDKSVIGRLHENQFRILKKIFKQDGVYVANQVVRELKEPGNDDIERIKVDVIGWGAGCYDELIRKKKDGTDEEKAILKQIKLDSINVSEKPRGKGVKDYGNLRAQAAFSLRKNFEEGLADIDDEELGVQLANIRYKFQGGKYFLEDKKDFKARLGASIGSPDELDSYLIAKAMAGTITPHLY